MFRDGNPLSPNTAAHQDVVSLGPLERRVLDSLWERGLRASVRDLQPEFPAIAYTTLMTTLDRLYRKGMLDRAKDGRAYVYQPRYSRETLLVEVTRHTLGRLLRSGRALLRPILSSLVDTVSESDARALDELERLVRERRRRS